MEPMARPAQRRARFGALPGAPSVPAEKENGFGEKPGIRAMVALFYQLEQCRNARGIINCRSPTTAWNRPS